MFTIDDVLSKLKNVTQSEKDQNQWSASCPCTENHKSGDNTPSLSVKLLDDGYIMFNCHKGCNRAEILNAIGLQSDNSKMKLICSYSFDYGQYNDGLEKLRYIDANGKKTFRWRRRDSSDPSGYAYNKRGCKERLYFAGDPDANEVYLVEGEKDADSVHKLTGCTAASAPNGATTKSAGSKWRKEYTEQLKDKTVFILYDNDDAGRNFAAIEAQELTGKAEHVFLLDLPQAWPECPNKGDISDAVDMLGDEETKHLLRMMHQNASEQIQGITVRDAVKTGPAQQQPIPEFAPKGADYYNTANIQAPEPIVEDFIFPGLTLFAAPNKFGKSYTTLELSFCVATGEPFMGKAIRRQGPVLYLDLEGTEARTKKRLINLKRFPMPYGVEIQHLNDGEVRSIDNGIIDQMQKWISKYPDTVMIVIDMFKNVKGKKRREEDDYDAANRMYGALEAFALTNNISIFMTTHTTKRSSRDADDPFAEIMGSGGQFGSVDCGWILLGKRTEETKRFCVLCRDGEGMLDYEVKFSDYKYSIEGTAEEVEKRKALQSYYSNPVVRTIRKLVKDNGTWAGTSGDIAQAVNQITHKVIEGKAGVIVKKYSEMLYKLDKIHVDEPDDNGGAKGRLYRFSKVEPEPPELKPDI